MIIIISSGLFQPFSLVCAGPSALQKLSNKMSNQMQFFQTLNIQTEKEDYIVRGKTVMVWTDVVLLWTSAPVESDRPTFSAV